MSETTTTTLRTASQIRRICRLIFCRESLDVRGFDVLMQLRSEQDHDPGQCYACPIGRYSTEVGLWYKWHCFECAVGMYNDQVGMQTCKGCAKGTYSDDEGRSK